MIRSVNSQAVSSRRDLTEAIEAAEASGRGAVLIQIERDGANRFVALPIG